MLRLMFWLGVTSIVVILSGALCRYPKGYQTGVYKVNLEIAQEHCLAQVVNIHTRADKTLDLLLTNSPSPVNRVKGMPPIGKADHDIVYVEYDILKLSVYNKPRENFAFTNEQTWMVFVTT